MENETGERSNSPRGRVRISAPLSFGISYLGATLPAFLQTYPETRVDFALSDRKVDLLAEGFDLALRIASLDDFSLLSHRLCTVRLLLVGSPDYLDRHGRPAHPAELARHCALAYTGGASRGVWRFTHPTFGEEAAEPPARVWTDNADLLNPALVAGQGLAIQPEFFVWRELRDGKLAVAMPDWSVTPLSLHLVMPPSLLRLLRVQVLIGHLARELASAP